MIFSPTLLNGSYIIKLNPLQDERGWFIRYYCKEEFQKINHTKEWVQMNHSFTKQKGSLRGMHYQINPSKEIKMVRCISGAVFDVIIDLRSGSDTFLKWIGVELSAENKKMVYIPEGFAHGFQCLEDDCELLYHHSTFYNPTAEAGIRFNDPLININWPLPLTAISPRDQQHPYLNQNFKGI
ncbi:MAG: dTDP-4-dehydrorhamnose 3,5-epimerase [Chitinophagaceae bacterium]